MLGHGVQFRIFSGDGDSILLAWLDGYEWLHGDPDEVEILISAKHEQLAPPHFRPSVESAVRTKRFPGETICGEVNVLFNA